MSNSPETPLREIFLLLAVLASPFFGFASAAAAHDRQVVSLQVTHQSFAEHRPWTKGTPNNRIGSAVVLDDEQLLTQANLVSDAILIQVQKHGRAARVPARVVHSDPDIDLALLEVDESGFFDDLQPAPFARSAPGKGTVQSVRWRSQQYEVSDGQVAGVNVREGPYGSITHAFLSLSTDLSNGGWAEPVFLNGRLVGLSVMQSGQLATVIPVEMLSAYVREARSSEYVGFASFRPYWQFGQDRAMAAYLGLTGKPRGIVLRWVPWGSTGCEALQPWDLILEVGGHQLDALGNYEHPHYGQLAFQHILVDGRLPGDTVPFRVVRRGQELDLEVKLRANPGAEWLIPDRRDQAAPPYLVAGGLVLRELDGNYLRSFAKDWREKGPSDLVQRYDREREFQTPERRRVLMLSQVLPDPYNLGYHQMRNLALAEINGRAVDTIADADEAFRHPMGEFHRLKFYRDDQLGEVILDASGLGDATARVLQNYGIPGRIRTRPAGPRHSHLDCKPQLPERH